MSSLGRFHQKPCLNSPCELSERGTVDQGFLLDASWNLCCDITEVLWQRPGNSSLLLALILFPFFFEHHAHCECDSMRLLWTATCQTVKEEGWSPVTRMDRRGSREYLHTYFNFVKSMCGRTCARVLPFHRNALDIIGVPVAVAAKAWNGAQVKQCET
jgi:hypothetical protein